MSTTEDGLSSSTQDLLFAALNQSGLTTLDSPASAVSDEVEHPDDSLAALGLLPPAVNPAPSPQSSIAVSVEDPSRAVDNAKNKPTVSAATALNKVISLTQSSPKIIKVPIPKTGPDGKIKPNIIRLPLNLSNGSHGPIIVKKPISVSTVPKIITIAKPASTSVSRTITASTSSIVSNSSNALTIPTSSSGSLVSDPGKTTYAKVMVGNKKILIPIIKKNGVSSTPNKIIIPATKTMPSSTTVTLEKNSNLAPTALPTTVKSQPSTKQPDVGLNLGSLFVESAEKEATSIMPAPAPIVSDSNNNSGPAKNVVLMAPPTTQYLSYSRTCVSPLSPVADILSSISNLRPHSPLLGNTANLANGRSSSPLLLPNSALKGNRYSTNVALHSNVQYTQVKPPAISRSQSVTTFYKNPRTKLEKDLSVADLKHKSLENRKTSDELVQQEEWEEEQTQHASTYAEYKPSKLKIGLPHPDSVVETSSLSSVPPPDITYRISIPEETIDYGQLSALQLETITYACQKHLTFLPSGERAGFLIGDGAGVGKGRTVAGIIFENYLLGRKRSLWFSVSNDLKYDAERDLKDIGAKNIHVHMLNKFKYGKISSRENSSVKKGVIFATYSSLIGESHTDSKYGTRLKQILHWCGKDFDGVIVFDECHKAKNLIPSGSAKPTKTGYTVLELQRRLPNARVIYASATGASEPRNMAYMSRIGLWGIGTPFQDFMDFIQAVERRGVGAMELVAMDLKSRGAYIARQLSFHGVSFRIHEVSLTSSFIKMYNGAVRLWVAAREAFQVAASLIDAEHHMKKTMWGQFWAAHQRFFKYLCIAAKVDYTSQLAREAVKHGKCVVIGLQSTGEARTLDQLEKSGGELDDFVSTAKGVFENLIEQHFPAPNRKRVTDLFGKDFYKKDDGSDEAKNGKRKRPEANELSKQPSLKKRKSSIESGSESEDESLSGGEDMKFSGFHSDVSIDLSDEDIGKIFGGSDSDEWGSTNDATPKKKHKKNRKNKKEEGSDMDEEADRMLEMAGLKPASVPSIPKETEKASLAMTLDSNSANSNSGLTSMTLAGLGPVERAQSLKQELLSKLESLCLPNNTLDELIDALGGPENVAEMTGRKGRVVSTDEGNIQYESRSENDVRCDMLNLAEKQRFMDGEKNIAIISEAASSGISLQSDRRARNQRRRLHITLELPWSADRAIQQFGRTHRSNQVNAPEYVFLISELAGEQRFASVVAKRLESLGALTHGDRRATETRDLSQYNFDNKFGRMSLEAIMKAIAGLDIPLVHPPLTYPGLFFKDIRNAMVGVGLISLDGVSPQAQLEKEYNNIVKFMNRILGMEVMQQNAVFQFFSDTLSAIVQKAKSQGQFDQGIMDVASSEDCVERVDCRRFELRSFSEMRSETNTAVDSGFVELHTVKIERGMPWMEAEHTWSELCTRDDDGFYLTHLKRNQKCMAVLCVENMKSSRKHQQDHQNPDTVDSCRFFVLHRPNTGKQLKRESLAVLKSRYRKVTPHEAKPWWDKQFEASLDACSHAYWQGYCSRQVHGVPCSIGKRRRTYHVLSGSVLAAWRLVEQVLSLSAPAMYKMQIVRLKTEDGGKLVGLLIPSNCVQSLVNSLKTPSQPTNSVSMKYIPQIPSSAQRGNVALHRTASTPLFAGSSVYDPDAESDNSFEEVDEDLGEEDFSPDEMTSSVLFPNSKKYSWMS